METRLPALAHNHDFYAEDIAPLGFQFVEIDGRVTDGAVTAGRDYLHHPDKTAPAVEHNYQLGRQYFSCQTLKRLLKEIMNDK